MQREKRLIDDSHLPLLCSDLSRYHLVFKNCCFFCKKCSTIKKCTAGKFYQFFMESLAELRKSKHQVIDTSPSLKISIYVFSLTVFKYNYTYLSMLRDFTFRKLFGISVGENFTLDTIQKCSIVYKMLSFSVSTN